ncbi:MAG: hypothetical protein GY862_39175 [Gammaproteobacteria bacterium]|nr:hypothetical protein [Gammaproteobacteria bacterium]
MIAITCPGCGKEYELDPEKIPAGKVPRCGKCKTIMQLPEVAAPSHTFNKKYPFVKAMLRRWKKILLALVIFFFLYLILFAERVKEIEKLKLRSKPSWHDGRYYCKDAVKQRLKAPSTADFSGDSGYRVTLPNDGPQIYRFEINGMVEAKNPLGVPLRSRYSCRVFTSASGNAWRVYSLEIHKP